MEILIQSLKERWSQNMVLFDVSVLASKRFPITQEVYTFSH